MALAIVYSRASAGITAPLVTVEAHLSNGMATFTMVGLAAAVKESRDRVRSALVNSAFEFPIKHITINLAPADLPKEGGRFDLPIALGILAASGQIPAEELSKYEFTGELALSGELRAVRGILPMVLAASQANRILVVPKQNAREAALVRDAKVLYAEHLLEVCAHLSGHQLLPQCEPPQQCITNQTTHDLTEVKGQTHAKRALEIAAAGRHSLLLVGPPGTGKTMLASRLPGILPMMSEQEALEVAAVASVSNAGFNAEQWQRTPFRAPHHTSSSMALSGGGRPPKPGEISLAHHGVLFLDELPEYHRHVLECLREPLESGCITISRAAYQTIFPAQFQFIAAMNPCPCGYAGSSQDQCQCSAEQVKRYRSKLSGPLLDRLDMQVEVARLPPAMLANTEQRGDSSETVATRVRHAREYQLDRQKKLNALLTTSELETYAAVQPGAQTLLQQVMLKFNFSARVYHRIIKVARTIADIEQTALIQEKHIAEALQYRCLDKSNSLNYK